LKIGGRGLPAALRADTEGLKPGRFVLTVGVIYGESFCTTSFGILSAVNRLGGRALQTDAAITVSRLGGALVDIEGRLLGMNVLLSRRTGMGSGVGFAVPLHRILKVLPKLKKGAVIEPAFLGVALSAWAKDGTGAQVERVIEGTAADRCGLQVGDAIVEMGGWKINDLAGLRDVIGAMAAGEKIEIVVRRKNRMIRLFAILGSRLEKR
jgi:serine protease Do